MRLHTTDFDMTFEHATEVANTWSKGVSNVDGRDLVAEWSWSKEYNTAIKGTPAYPALPEYCWAVTNKFDPRVSKGE